MHLDNGILHLLLGSLLLGLLLIPLKKLLRSLCGFNCNLFCDFMWDMFVVFLIRNNQAHLLLHLPAVFQRNVFVNMGHRRSHNCLSLRVHLHQLLDLGILNSRHVNLNVSLVVLLNKGFYRLTRKHILVLCDWVGWNHVIFNWNQFRCVFDSQYLNHLPVE